MGSHAGGSGISGIDTVRLGHDINRIKQLFGYEQVTNADDFIRFNPIIANLFCNKNKSHDKNRNCADPSSAVPIFFYRFTYYFSVFSSMTFSCDFFLGSQLERKIFSPKPTARAHADAHAVPWVARTAAITPAIILSRSVLQ